MREKALELRNVSVVRDGRYILRSIDLDIYSGENVAVIGPNGSGKTTLLRLLRGDINPFYDEDEPALLRIFGEERWNLFDIRGRMGVVSMDLQNSFPPDMTVMEVICSGLLNTLDIFPDSIITEAMRAQVYSSAVVMGIDGLLDREIESLSLGEMRCTLIARALITDPEILVLDEPMTGLDIVMKSRFRNMFDRLISQGVSIVMITHDLSDIPSSVDTIIGMKDGTVHIQGSRRDVLNDRIISELYGENIKVLEDNGSYQMIIAGGEDR